MDEGDAIAGRSAGAGAGANIGATPARSRKAKGVVDGWNVDADELAREHRWILESVKATDVTSWPDGEHSAETLGPNNQG